MLLTKDTLREEILSTLQAQGFTTSDREFYLENCDSKFKRDLHIRARLERLNQHILFLESALPLAEKYMKNNSDLQIDKITPRLVEVHSGSLYEKLFRWWNLTWWSLPYERAYGRQMRFIVWDDYHNAPIGLIGLQSPILCWNARDSYLGITTDSRDYWVNQSLSAQRLGALPPYNKFLGGKLVAMLMTSSDVRQMYQKKYDGYQTLLMEREIPANLLFITTTGAYGKSSVYNRLRFQGNNICKFIGYTNGSGSFHIPDSLYEGLLLYFGEQRI